MLDALCGERPELRGLLEVLVGRYETASSCLLSDLAAASVEEEGPCFGEGELLLGRFRVGKELGQGGMSRVYRAEDLVLGQAVALKVLHPRLLGSDAARDRFRREVARSREISHPNVCRVYEWFEAQVEGELIPFLSMEFVEAETLAARLRRDPSWIQTHGLEVLEQLVAGLEAVHLKGVVHLDIKPSNVFLASDAKGGLRVVIGDFGLAVLQQGRAEGGTPGYMAPEQLLNGEVSLSADIYSLGLVAGELDPGARGARRAAVQRALQVDPGLRPASVREFLSEWKGEQSRRHWMVAAGAAFVSLGGAGLWRWKSGAGDRTRLALLPFELSRGSREVDRMQVEGLTDGLTEQTNQRLQGMPDLAVASHASVLAVTSQGLTPQDLGQRLGADVLVQPVLTRTDSGWQIGVRLVDLREQKLERAVKTSAVEVPAGRMAEVPARVAGMVLGTLGKGEAMVKDSRGVLVNEEAYAAYLEGRNLWSKKVPKDLLVALEKFQQCLQLAPQFGFAESGIVDCLCALADQGERSPAATKLEAMQRARRGVELAPNEAACRASLGIALSIFEFDLAGAQQELKAAIALNRGYAPAHVWLSAVNLKSGEWRACLDAIDLAYESDRMQYPLIRARSGMRYFLRDYDKAIAGFLEVERLNRGYWATAEYLCECYARSGKSEEAKAHAETAIRLGNRHPRALAYAAVAYALCGELAQGRQLAEESAGAFARGEYFQPIHLCRAFAELGDLDRAFQYLSAAVEVGDPLLAMAPVYHSFDRLRGDGRYAALLRRVAIRYPGNRPPVLSALNRQRDSG
jgi:TolB-like protein/tetratricopeptide (TPR) repeat protein